MSVRYEVDEVGRFAVGSPDDAAAFVAWLREGDVEAIVSAELACVDGELSTDDRLRVYVVRSGDLDLRALWTEFAGGGPPHQCRFSTSMERTVEEEWDDCSRAIVVRECLVCGARWRMTLQVTSLVRLERGKAERG